MNDPADQTQAGLEHINDTYGDHGKPATDASLRIRGRNILDLRLDGGQTVREYLTGLLWGTIHQSGGSALIAPIRSIMASHGMIDGEDQAAAQRLTAEAIEVMGAEPFRPIGTKTATERRLAQLQRRGNSGKKHR